MIDFEEVYRDYLEDVYRFSLALCRDPVLAEDLTQETFFRALEHIGQFRGECTLRVWLCQIAKHAWLTHCRRQRRREPEPELREEGPEERLAQKETAMEVHQVLHSLPEPYREVFALRVLGELSFREIGALFHKTESWARVTFHRARLKIKEAL